MTGKPVVISPGWQMAPDKRIIKGRPFGVGLIVRIIAYRKWENHGSPLKHKGWTPGRISPRLPVAGEVFFLTSPLIERLYSPIWPTSRRSANRKLSCTGFLGSCY